jgi:integrase
MTIGDDLGHVLVRWSAIAWFAKLKCAWIHTGQRVRAELQKVIRIFVPPPVETVPTMSSMSSQLSGHATEDGVAVIHLHDLRHSHAIQILEAATRLDGVAKRLGHNSVAFTLGT